MRLLEVIFVTRTSQPPSLKSPHRSLTNGSVILYTKKNMPDLRLRKAQMLS